MSRPPGAAVMMRTLFEMLTAKALLPRQNFKDIQYSGGSSLSSFFFLFLILFFIMIIKIIKIIHDFVLPQTHNLQGQHHRGCTSLATIYFNKNTTNVPEYKCLNERWNPARPWQCSQKKYQECCCAALYRQCLKINSYCYVVEEYFTRSTVHLYSVLTPAW